MPLSLMTRAGDWKMVKNGEKKGHGPTLQPSQKVVFVPMLLPVAEELVTSPR